MLATDDGALIAKARFLSQRARDPAPQSETPSLSKRGMKGVWRTGQSKGGRTTRALALRFLEDLQSLPIRVESSEEAWSMEALLRLERTGAGSSQRLPCEPA